MTSTTLVRKRSRRAVAAVFVAFAAILLMAVSVGEVVGRAGASNRKVQCANNLKNIGGMLAEMLVSRPNWYRKSGSRLLVVYTRGLIRRGDERVFACPEDAERFDRIAAVSALPFSPNAEEIAACETSYLSRDLDLFPIPEKPFERNPLAVCLHHWDGVNVLYDDSAVIFHDRESLGLGEDDPIETGPQSKSELLRLFPPRPR